MRLGLSGRIGASIDWQRAWSLMRDDPTIDTLTIGAHPMVMMSDARPAERPAATPPESLRRPSPARRELASSRGPQADPYAHVTRLQQSVGNQAVQARLSRSSSSPSGDRYDRSPIASPTIVLREAPDPRPSFAPLPAARPLAASATVRLCNDYETVQVHLRSADAALSSETATPTRAIARGSGRPLPAATRATSSGASATTSATSLHTDAQAG